MALSSARKSETDKGKAGRSIFATPFGSKVCSIALLGREKGKGGEMSPLLGNNMRTLGTQG